MTCLNIVDFDNTIFRTDIAMWNAYAGAIARVSRKNLLLTKDRWDSNFGNSVVKILKEDYEMNDEQIKEVKRIKKEIYPIFFDMIEPNYELLNGLEFDKKYNNAINVICSNTEEEVIEDILKFFNKESIFNKVIGRNSRFGYEVKPDPGMMLDAYFSFMWDCDEIKMFDDSSFGLKACENFKKKLEDYNVDENVKIFKIQIKED